MKRWPIYDEEQIADVVDVLRSGRVNAWTGDHVKTFERAYARSLGRRHAVALANGSLALDLAMKILHIGAGDEVIVTPRSFVASAACVMFAGATPVFADVDPTSGNLSAETIAPKITARTKAVIVVHIAGWPCDMAPIMELAKRSGIKVIEDCAQAHGAEYNGRPIGSFGDIAAFSFCQDKIITTGGEGGLVAMDDRKLWLAAWSLKDHGKNYNVVFAPHRPSGFRWLHDSIGTNWRMTSIQAVLGLRQLERLPDWIHQRERNAAIWINTLADLPMLYTPRLDPAHRHAWYRCYFYIKPEMLSSGWSRDELIAAVNAAGVPCFSGSCSEIYLEHAFADAGVAPSERLPVARQLGETSIAFLVDPSWTVEETAAAASTTRSILVAAARQLEAA
ncbi:DegT/DnrJ/EryC1/StrS aminotransferase family protein [Mesorhizobium opportunistum]|uniref:DegT/DnrJ/EryC1/StrS family aminotransferase n=1 Tax=Mesorhizobium opportunistum TaxID=593909 RepID=UPI003338F78B